MTIELKRCPFCGGEAKTSFETTDPENKFRFGWIGCQKCRVFINYINNSRGLKEAAETWNRRVDDAGNAVIMPYCRTTLKKIQALRNRIAVYFLFVRNKKDML